MCGFSGKIDEDWVCFVGFSVNFSGVKKVFFEFDTGKLFNFDKQ
jgi:hypothetical protein